MASCCSSLKGSHDSSEAAPIRPAAQKNSKKKVSVSIRLPNGVGPDLLNAAKSAKC